MSILSWFSACPAINYIKKRVNAIIWLLVIRAVALFYLRCIMTHRAPPGRVWRKIQQQIHPIRLFRLHPATLP